MNFYSSQSSTSTFNNLFFGLHRADNLPIPVSKMKATINFNTIVAGSTFKVRDVDVSCYQINHQGITLGYRLDYKGGSVAIITDNAPIDNGNLMGEGMAEKAQKDPVAFEKDFNDGLVEFLRDCHTVVFDTHFTEENLKPDWGHSTPQIALEFCKLAGVKRLVLFHHAPEDLDEDVRRKVESVAQAAKDAGIDLHAAIEGDVWELS
ncbi:MBL fold metallo-hydrolase [bacterium]|nr:MBL fold metallo-hydrolase [bacterium]